MSRWLWFVPGLLLAASLQAQPTYSREVSRIFQAKCQQCHREGDIAPFALPDYDAAANWSADIQRVVQNGIMPPWKPVPGYGEFRDSYALSADEKQTILDWIAAGAPQGDPADLPDAAPKAGDWALGQPDVVLQMPQQYTPPRGRDVYRCFALPETGLDTLKYLGALDVLPGNRQIVHHVLLYADTTGTSANLDGQDGNPGYDCFGGPGLPINFTNLFQALDSLGGLGGWAPGQRPHFLPDGIGIELPAKARVVMQVHYYPSRGTGPDQTQVGLYFARSDVQKRLYHVPVVNMNFRIEPGEVKDVTAKFPPVPLPLGAKAITVYPHMHLLGRKIKVDLINPDKTETPLIYEDNWEFNWQGEYTFAQPIPIANYSTLRTTCTFDNTADNPKNPNNPLVAVGWGERTTDEMCIAFVGITLDNDPLTVLKTNALKAITASK